jgi:hypothetical protein
MGDRSVTVRGPFGPPCQDFTWTTRKHGPAVKLSSPVNRVLVIVNHSARRLILSGPPHRLPP